MRFKVVFDSICYDELIQFESDSFIQAARFYLNDKKDEAGYDEEKWSVTLYDNDKVIESFTH